MERRTRRKSFLFNGSGQREQRRYPGWRSTGFIPVWIARDEVKTSTPSTGVGFPHTLLGYMDFPVLSQKPLNPFNLCWVLAQKERKRLTACGYMVLLP